MANEATTRTMFTVSAAPFWHSGRTLANTSLQTLLALAPALALAVFRFGFDALQVVALAGVTAVVVQVLCEKLMEREITPDNYSALVVGVLFAILLPSTAPWWMVMIGAAVSMVLGRMVCGGIGGNPVKPAVVGWAVLTLSWPDLVDINGMLLSWDLVYPASELKYFGVEAIQGISRLDMLLGNNLGALGAAQNLGLIVGGIYLMARGRLRLYIPLSFLAGVFLTSLLYYLIDPQVYADPIFHLLAGSTMLAAFFLLPDTSTSPVGRTPMILYGLFAGALVIIIRTYGIYPDGAPFAVLLANLITPLLDLIQPKPFGAR